MINRAEVKNNYTDLCTTTVVDIMHLDKSYIDVCSVFKGALKLFSGKSGGYEKNVYCGYMNYWLNQHFRSSKDSTCDTITFYTTMINRDAENSTILNNCRGEIYNMEEPEFNNMYVLDNMYKNLNEYKAKMKTRHGEACENAKECSRLYNSIIGKCVKEKTSSLCNELSNINSKIKKEGWMKEGNNVCGDILSLLSAEEAYELNGKSTFFINIISISVIMVGMIFIFLIFYKVNKHFI
ncbi:hypothetical protein PVMG_04519 [Plasmodium vivax Mauritania I]|uniref:Variable surface protein n=1 Tax=Plasmodium vivax Mauritania I TaxID=1035515 RepID=A0A0J9T3L3_PLAVI|nr:hypothetical protein PVMG_04519 [Plasmodium vivax Mauritania I]